MSDRKKVVMTVTFADGSRFHQLADRTMVDDKGLVITRENCPDHYDDMVKTVTPNVVTCPQASFDQMKKDIAELGFNLIPCPKQVPNCRQNSIHRMAS